jgi:large repetitive protein
VGRGRTRSIRIALAAALVVVAAGVVAATAGALAFDDATPCPDTHPLFVCPAGTVDGSYSIQLIGRGGCEPEFVYRVTSGALPTGLSLASNGQLSGAPTTSGTYNFWLQLHDVGPLEGGPAWCTNPKDADREFSLTINPRVLVTTASAPAATLGANYSLGLTALMKTGPNTTAPSSSPLTWSLVGGQLPPGVALDAATGALSGAPTAEGTFLATFKAALVDGRSDTKGLEITVRKPLAIASSKPLATSPQATLWEVGVPFSAKLAAGGGSGTYTWSIATGSLPQGFALAADGTVAGTTRTPGAYRATLRLTDTEGRTADYAANMVVAPRLAVSTLALRPGKVGRLYRAKVAATGGVLPKIWKLTRGPLPRGIRFDRTLGVLSGTPTKPGGYRLTFQITDGLKVVARKTLRLTVLDGR